MSFTNEQCRTERQENDRALEERNRAAWSAICDSCDVSEGESFYRRVLTFCEGVISLEKFLMMQSTCPEGYDLTNPEWWKGTKDALIAELMEKKRKQLAPYGNLDPKDAVELRNFEVNLYNLSKKELRAKRNEIKFRGEIKDASAARQYLQRHRLLTSQRQFADKSGALWPRLPAMVVPEGHVQARPLNAFFLYKILDVAGLRKYVNRYSLEQINERVENTRESLRGESQ